MEFILLLIGVGLIISGVMISKRKTVEKTPVTDSETELKDYQQAIQDSHLAFRQQFELSQHDLQNLYAPDFFRILDKLERIENKLDEVLQVEAPRIKQMNETSKPTDLKPSIEIDEFLQKRIEMYEQLVSQDKTVEEMAKLLNVGKGEILLLRNLSEKLGQH